MLYCTEWLKLDNPCDSSLLLAFWIHLLIYWGYSFKVQDDQVHPLPKFLFISWCCYTSGSNWNHMFEAKSKHWLKCILLVVLSLLRMKVMIFMLLKLYRHKSYKAIGASLVAQSVKGLPAMQETWVRFLGREDPLEKEMATHSSTLA